MNTNTVMSHLAVKGIKEVHIGFSGGGDEGGAEDMTLIMTDGENVNVDLWPNSNSTNQVISAEVIEALQQPIYDKYGGFAGDFQVYGTLIWNAITNKVSFKGQESTYVGFEDEL